MRKHSRWAVVGIVIALAGLTMTGPQLAAQEVSDEALVALQVFIDTDCEIGEEPISALQGVLPFLDELEATIIDIVLEGPPGDALDAYREDVDELWATRAAYMDGKDAGDMREEGLDAAAAAIALAVTEEEYRARQERTFVLKHREKATILLAFLEAGGSERAAQTLADLSGDPDLAPIVDLARERAQRG